MQRFKNQFKQALAAPVLAGDTNLTITDASALDFPFADDFYLLTLIQSGTNTFELVKAISRVGNVVTVLRAQEGTMALPFLTGDSVEIRLTAASCDGFSLPVGSILAWSPGYFTGGSNSGFAGVLCANNAAAANAYLNPKGWYICDGAALNVANSPIFMGAGKYLPNLSDNRFLQGSTAFGGIGGKNVNDHQHYTAGHILTESQMPSHTHIQNAHNHLIVGDIGNPGTAAGLVGSGSTNGSYNSIAPTVATNQNAGGNASHDHGLTNTNTDTENRPTYLSCFFIIKAA